jgi:excinuclease ABC subunit A
MSIGYACLAIAVPESNIKGCTLKNANEERLLSLIEHNLDLIKTADYVIDLGPEGGDGGGTVIAKGTPEQIAAVEQSYTGQYLRKLLEHT